eukprot:CAMPEP_0202436818 /NCGR_PEP_ID=MMETSP1345-20130828/26245_1 /ASSEMBLY_ACC=CAM_ASM_000843 /TAXON_ID=342563 /ORGANISM="Fabrea Fabrea salina" /LENGTH=1731 /DNA_ID=CAMNT_0049050339 /DNA_START=6 /DNA_END=5201 /DNA_ORIENTATION=+
MTIQIESSVFIEALENNEKLWLKNVGFSTIEEENLIEFKGNLTMKGCSFEGIQATPVLSTTGGGYRKVEILNSTIPGKDKTLIGFTGSDEEIDLEVKVEQPRIETTLFTLSGYSKINLKDSSFIVSGEESLSTLASVEGNPELTITNLELEGLSEEAITLQNTSNITISNLQSTVTEEVSLILLGGSETNVTLGFQITNSNSTMKILELEKLTGVSFTKFEIKSSTLGDIMEIDEVVSITVSNLVVENSQVGKFISYKDTSTIDITTATFTSATLNGVIIEGSGTETETNITLSNFQYEQSTIQEELAKFSELKTFTMENFQFNELTVNDPKTKFLDLDGADSVKLKNIQVTFSSECSLRKFISMNNCDAEIDSLSFSNCGSSENPLVDLSILTVEGNSALSVTNLVVSNVYSYSYSATVIDFKGTSSLNEGTTIELNGVTIENVENKGDEVFSLDTAYELTMSDVNVKNSKGGIKGVFYMNNIPRVTVERVTCDTCESTSGNGGSIYYLPCTVSPPTLSIANSVFTGSKAGEKGGALCIDSESSSTNITLSIQSTEFTDVRSKSGGAIYITEIVSFTDAKISDITISNAYSQMGAAIEDHHNSGTLELQNVVVTGSQGFYCDIYASYKSEGTKMTIKDSSFLDGSCDHVSIHFNSWVENLVIEMQTCVIRNGQNTAMELQKVDFRADNITFRNNTHTMILAQKESTLNITNSYFADFESSQFEVSTNTVKQPGISVAQSNLNLWGCTLENQVGAFGGFIESEYSNVTIQNSTFQNGRATEEGGAIYLTSSNLQIHSSYFKNLHSGSGGAIGALLGSTIYISNSVFEEVSATNSGGAIESTLGTITILDSTIRNANATGVLLNYCEVSLINSRFENCLGEEGGAVRVVDSVSSLVKNCTFSENQATSNGGALVFKNSNLPDTTFYLEDSFFYNNSANQGGAVYLFNSATNITKNYFQNNSASEGGGVFIDYSSKEGTLSWVSNCSFVENSASSNGGSIRWKTVSPHISSNTYQNNTAPYGADIASYAVGMGLVTSNSRLLSGESLAYMEGIAPGQEIEKLAEIALRDKYGNIVTTDNSTEATLKSLNATLGGQTTVTAVNGVITFEKITVTGVINQNITVVIRASSIETNQQEVQDDETEFNPNLSVIVNLRDCKVGEENTGDQCKVCPSGEYSLSPDQACTACPSAAYCLGGWEMYPRASYWRPDPYTSTFYQCPNSDACLGSSDYSNYLGNCAEGYTGNMCQACKSGYSRTSENVCSPCPEPGTNFTILALILLLVVGLSVAMVITTLRSAYKPKSLQSIYIKIFTNYIQLVYLTTQFELSWPDFVLELFAVQKSTATATEQVFSVDCYIEAEDSEGVEETGNTEVFFQKVVIISLLPAIVWALSAAVWGLIAFFQSRLIYMKRELVTTMIVLFFLIHPTIVKLMFSIFACREIEGKGPWLIQNLEVQCWDEKHTLYALGVALPSILVWGIGVPTFMLYSMYKKSRYLFKIDNKLRFGFLFNGYKLSRFYWEFVILYRKIIVICLAVFLSTISIQVQALTCLLVLIVFLYMQKVYKPFVVDHLNQLETSAIFTATVTIYCGVYYLTNDLDEYSKILFFVLMLGCNAYFLVFWLKYMLKAGVEALLNAFPRIKNRLKKSDGFPGDFYNEEKMLKGVYREEDRTICTLLPHRSSQPTETLEGINSMMDLYREAFQHILEEEKESESSRPIVEELQPPSFREVEEIKVPSSE